MSAAHSVCAWSGFAICSFTLADLVDTTGFSWRLDSGHLHDDLGTFVEHSFYTIGAVLSFEVKATAVDPNGQLASWPLVADVRACVSQSSSCAF